MPVHFHPQPKPSKGARLRTEQTDREKAARQLSLLYRQVYKRDDYRCVACGTWVVVGSLNELKRAHPHHVVPRSRADKAVKHTSGNVCTLCPFCHADIGQKLFISGNADEKLTIRRVR